MAEELQEIRVAVRTLMWDQAREEMAEELAEELLPLLVEMSPEQVKALSPGMTLATAVLRGAPPDEIDRIVRAATRKKTVVNRPDLAPRPASALDLAGQLTVTDPGMGDWSARMRLAVEHGHDVAGGPDQVKVCARCGLDSGWMWQVPCRPAGEQRVVRDKAVSAANGWQHTIRNGRCVNCKYPVFSPEVQAKHCEAGS